jgi:hypothetical protein
MNALGPLNYQRGLAAKVEPDDGFSHSNVMCWSAYVVL